MKKLSGVFGKRGSSGQAFVEAALFMPLMAFFLFTIMWFGSVLLTKQQLASAARYGTDLIVYTPYSKSYIEGSVKSYLTDKSIVGRIINPDNLTVSVVINDFPEFETTLSFNNIFDILESIFSGGINILEQATMYREVSSIDITYKYKLPFVIKISGKDSVTLKAHSEVLSGTGSAGATRRG